MVKIHKSPQDTGHHWITNLKDSLFSRNIRKMKEIVSRKMRYSKGKEIEVKKQILRVLNNRTLSTADISLKIKKSKSKTLKKLKQLENEGYIRPTGKVAINRSYLWKTNGGEKIGT